MDGNTETPFPYDSRFRLITILNRLRIIKNVLVEPRIGYAPSSSFVNTDDKTKIATKFYHS